MKTIEYRDVLDRSEWPPGPWDGEPDKRQWETDAGLPGLAVRNSLGGLCGYVGVPLGHPFHRVDADDAQTRGALDCHGGLTHSGSCMESYPEAEGVCHTPDPGEPDDVWWFGFDCVHMGDLAPAETNYTRYASTATYRTIDYVAAEVESLARQLTVTAP